MSLAWVLSIALVAGVATLGVAALAGLVLMFLRRPSPAKR
jgi:nitrate reductase gamma subunit